MVRILVRTVVEVGVGAGVVLELEFVVGVRIRVRVGVVAGVIIQYSKRREKLEFCLVNLFFGV
jgi:hypothetical protein